MQFFKKYTKKFRIFLIISTTFLVPATALAHVRYLINDTDLALHGGNDLPFFLAPLTNPKALLLILLTLSIVALCIYIATTVPVFKEKLADISTRAHSYTPLIPWMIRLSLGIALIGAGVSNHLVSPVLSGMEHLATFQILIGFFLLLGFLVVPSALATLALYMSAIFMDWYILGNLEFVALALALIFLDNERPGLDDLLDIPHFSPLTHLKQWTPIILRIGIGSAMIFLAVYEKILNPHVSALIVENFALQSIVPVSIELWVFGAGIIECLIGFALILGLWTRVTSAIAFVVLSLSFFYFGEDVASHITLFGALSVLFVTAGGKWSVDAFKKKTRR